MQLNLPLEGLPSGDDNLWEQFDQATREALIDTLARVIAKVVAEQRPMPRENDHE